MTASRLLEPSAFERGADERMTAERTEVKYLISPDRVPRLLEELAEHLPSHRFVGEGANRLPGAHHFVTTIYFDTRSKAHYRGSVDDQEHNVKIRAKEYYDLHPSLAELATDPRQIVRYQPWVWFELKRREGARTSKRRFRLPKHQVPEFFARGRVDLDAISEAEAPFGAVSGLSEVLSYCHSLEEPLDASAVVNYRRLSFQDAVGSLRITLDLALAFYAPTPDLWTRDHALLRSTLGPARGSLAEAVLEVKRRAASPAWLAPVLARAGAEPAGFSKFVAASEAVHGATRRL